MAQRSLPWPCSAFGFTRCGRIDYVPALAPVRRPLRWWRNVHLPPLRRYAPRHYTRLPAGGQEAICAMPQRDEGGMTRSRLIQVELRHGRRLACAAVPTTKATHVTREHLTTRWTARPSVTLQTKGDCIGSRSSTRPTQSAWRCHLRHNRGCAGPGLTWTPPSVWVVS